MKTLFGTYFDNFAADIHRNSAEKGFYDGFQGTNEQIALRLALIHSEVSEALEELRKSDFDKNAFGLELADVVIRLMDLASVSNIPLGDLIVEKHEKNKLRPRMHGNKRF